MAALLQRAPDAATLEQDAATFHEAVRETWPAFEEASGEGRRAVVLLRHTLKTVPRRAWVALCGAGAVWNQHVQAWVVPGAAPDALKLFGLYCCAVRGGNALEALAYATGLELSPALDFVTRTYHALVEVPLAQSVAEAHKHLPETVLPTDAASAKQLRAAMRRWGAFGGGFGELGYLLDFRVWHMPDGRMEGLVAFSDRCEGPPGFVHGGCIATVLDEAASMATRKLGPMTMSLQVSYRRPIPLLSVLLVRGHLVEGGAGTYSSFVELVTHYGEQKATAEAVFSYSNSRSKL